MREVPDPSEMAPRFDEPEIYTPILNPCKEGCDPDGCWEDCECGCHRVTL